MINLTVGIYITY